MIPYKQTLFGEGHGNCFQVSIASILRLPVEDVPHFCDNFNEKWFEDCVAWAEARGLNCVDIAPWEGQVEFLRQIDDHYIITGKSPRGDFYHCVVGHKGTMVHDPHPDDTFIAEPPVMYTFLVPKSRSWVKNDGTFEMRNA